MENNFKLKFTHGVEIGAELAYRGHYKRTNDFRIKQIADDEVIHRKLLFEILEDLDDKPSDIIDGIFQIIGSIVGFLCLFSPKFLLNKVAYSLEIFAVWSYNDLAKNYPEHKETLIDMARVEDSHKEYFSVLK